MSGLWHTNNKNISIVHGPIPFIDESFLDKYNDHIKIDKYYLEYEPIYQLYYSLLNVYLWDRSYIEDVRKLLEKIKI